MSKGKTLTTIALSLALTLGAIGPVSAEEAEKTFPQAGETVEGFVLEEEREFPLVGADILLFEHEKTGAKLMYIANEDTNRVFDLTFMTRATDNTGLPHVFEHATLDGSEKYPSKALFFNLSYQTYNTYMNASTYQDMTTYPIASLSEEQLLKYADYYTDSCFNPLILEDENIFREEAWRYRLADAEDELTIEGTVYSEMLGALTLSRMASYNAMRTALPGAYAGNVSGGDPEFIPDMTFEALKAYHEKYYHPSNCVAFLYGAFDDFTAFLKLLDAEFSKYEKREFTFEEPDYTPISSPVNAEYAFGVEEGSDTERGAEIYYAFVCPGLRDDSAQYDLINTLTDILSEDASPLMVSLHNALPAGEFSVYVQSEGPEDMLVVHASQVEKEDAQTLKETVDAALADVAENGFAADMIEAVTASLKLDILLSAESDSVGVDVIPSIAYMYSVSGNLFSYLDYVDALMQIENWNSQGLYQEAVSRWIIGNETTALATTYPLPGGKEEKDAALADRLAEVKTSMSEEELQAVIDFTNRAEEEDDASAYIAQLQAVTVESLPEDFRYYELSDETGEDGIRRTAAIAGVDGIGQTAVFLDISGLPQEDIHWLHLYLDLLGEMDTKAHTREELKVLKSRYLYNGEIRLSLFGKGSDYQPKLRFGWIGVDDELADGYDLVYELLYDTDFSDIDRLTSMVQQKKSGLKTSITNSIYSILIYRATAISNDLYRYYNYYNYLDYYTFLEQAEALCAEAPEIVQQKLAGIAEAVHNRANAVTAFAGNEQSIALNQDLADAFLAKLDEKPIEPAAYDLPAPAAREGIIVESAVQFNLLAADNKEIGIDESDAGMDAVTALVSDAFLYPQLRDQYGAYGVLHGDMEDGSLYIVSYRDPNVQETFDVYDSLADQIEALDADQETLDGYILSSYSYYALSDGELSGAMDALLGNLDGDEQEKVQLQMQQLKSVTPEKIAAAAEIYRKLAETGVRSTAGGAAAVNANADLYDVILNPFGAKDATETELTDVPEDSEYYEAVRLVFEEGLMAPLTEDTFGVDEPASLGDLAGALYVLVGGEQNAPEAAVEFLAQYGIVSEGASAEDSLTGNDCGLTLYYFSYALGLEAEEPAEGSEEVMTRGELAQTVADFVNALPQE